MLLYKVSEVSKYRGLTIQVWLSETSHYLGSMQVPEEIWPEIKKCLSGMIDQILYTDYTKKQIAAQEAYEASEKEKRNKLLEILLAKYTPEQLVKLLEAK